MASAIFASMLTLIITHGVLVTKGVRALGVGGRHGQAIALTAVSQTASRIRWAQRPFPSFYVRNRPPQEAYNPMLLAN